MTTSNTTTVVGMTKPQSMLRIEEHIAHLLPKAEIRERFAAVLMQQIRVSPALQKCTPGSVLAAVVRMAMLQLDPAIPNECWLVAYKDEASFLLGYGGLRKLALRSAEVQDVLVTAVHEHDVYTSPASPIVLPVHQRPARFAPRGQAIGYYAAALLHIGHWRVIEMSREEVKAHRNRYSRASQSTFWAEGNRDDVGLSNFDKMALKTALRQLCSPRHITLTADAYAAIAQEEMLYALRQEQTENRTVRLGNGHAAANVLFGGDEGLVGVPQVPEPLDDIPYHDVPMPTPELPTTNPVSPEVRNCIDQINRALYAYQMNAEGVEAFWHIRCHTYAAPYPEALPLATLYLLWKEVAAWIAPVYQQPKDTSSHEDTQDSASQMPVETKAPAPPHSDTSDAEKRTIGDAEAQKRIAEIDTAWRTFGLTDVQLRNYWDKAAVQYGAANREGLSPTDLTTMLRDTTTWIAKQPKKPADVASVSSTDLSFLPDAPPPHWRAALLPMLGTFPGDHPLLAEMFAAANNEETPDDVGRAVLARAQAAMEANATQGVEA